MSFNFFLVAISWSNRAYRASLFLSGVIREELQDVEATEIESNWDQVVDK